ncbi:YtxH domain-containing protein [Emticicia sp. CRIBPO]|uniref:YtxH domain-containing protein n=1 Tax=Emticicia sp. CRIBPO TaxID=2683258 RepID=UPI0014131709|nr:YtxH domain-containing protein [Emticicia sp. CRIBPO]NBA85009.1 YtxH domain-containing protein [Emticicia sp. CRIBPO]
MGVTSKHLATFILGAAAGVALHKYMKTEEGEQLMEDLKAKGNELKSEAESAMEKAPEYFEDLKNGASVKINEAIASLKERFPDAEKMLQELFGTLNKDTAATNTDTPEKPV